MARKKLKEQKENAKLVLLSDIYPDELIILPVTNRPIFPGIAIPLTFTDSKYVNLIDNAIEFNHSFIGVSLVKEVNEDDFFESELYDTGTLLKIIKVIHKEDNIIHFFAQSLQRIQLVSKRPADENEKWKIHYVDESKVPVTEELKAYAMAMISSLKELIKINPILQEQMRLSLSQMGYEKPALLMDLISTMLTADASKLQEVLETFDLYKRSEKILILIKEEIAVTQIQEKIQKQIEEKVSKQQKEYFLREQLKVIKKELGLEKDDKSAEIDKFNERIRKLTLTKEASEAIQVEMDKLSVLEPISPEYHVTRTYLNVLTELPWGIFSDDVKDINKATIILDKQHYGLKDVKQRILEFISTIIKRGKVAGSIICLVGPPGVGKTSVGKSIADALNRQFYRFSLGGIRDEAEIKGHRRTYIGAMPGKIIQSLMRTGTANPVIMLDEIDKVGASFQGDPASALLEVLDPEQNSAFLDHYLDVRFDLSNILFITTANQLDTIPRPLLDRMEVIQLAGYILEEKIQIAKKFLIPKQREQHGLKASEITINDAALTAMINGYAREAGVRGLENQIKKIMRQVTFKQASGNITKISITAGNLEEYLGKPVFLTEQLFERSIPGVTLGLAWTALGGTTLYIEASAIKGSSGGFKQTGQLGNVMQESSEIAYSYIRSIISHDDSVKDFFNSNFIHLHVPAGATPKDGPSAGITMALALYSLAVDKPVREGIAMTGELTLTGKVLPIGGVREKTIAARRVGIKELIFPRENKNDFDDLPDYIRKGLSVHFVDVFDDVLKVAYSNK
jgi:ATP-dependent Lon protease